MVEQDVFEIIEIFAVCIDITSLLISEFLLNLKLILLPVLEKGRVAKNDLARVYEKTSYFLCSVFHVFQLKNEVPNQEY